MGKNGVLVNPDDSQGLSEAMGYLMRIPEEREKSGERGKGFVQEHYSIERVADRYVALYHGC